MIRGVRDSPPVILPVIQPRGLRPRNPSRWRTVALISVHVVMIAHVAQWLLQGVTLSPVEPSEGMELAKHGIVNTGLVFFAAAILVDRRVRKVLLWLGMPPHRAPGPQSVVAHQNGNPPTALAVSCARVGSAGRLCLHVPVAGDLQTVGRATPGSRQDRVSDLGFLGHVSRVWRWPF